jgi:hypothetical protein
LALAEATKSQGFPNLDAVDFNYRFTRVDLIEIAAGKRQPLIRGILGTSWVQSLAQLELETDEGFEVDTEQSLVQQEGSAGGQDTDEGFAADTELDLMAPAMGSRLLIEVPVWFREAQPHFFEVPFEVTEEIFWEFVHELNRAREVTYDK